MFPAASHATANFSFGVLLKLEKILDVCVRLCVCVFVGLGTLERVSNTRCQCVVCYDGCVSGCVILLVPELDILRSVGSLEPIDSNRGRARLLPQIQDRVTPSKVAPQRNFSFD